jgi:hypothetical protein
MFGVRVGHTYQPFYTYSMQQALEDGVIIDVLKDYTTVATIAKIQPSSEIEAKTKTYEQGPYFSPSLCLFYFELFVGKISRTTTSLL